MITVRDNTTEHRFEIYDGENLAGFSEYKITKGKIALLHTEVAPELRGRGLARRLIIEAMETARRRGLAVLPYCPHVRRVIVLNPERYLDLVLVRDRERFNLPNDDADDSADDEGAGGDPLPRTLRSRSLPAQPAREADSRLVDDEP